MLDEAVELVFVQFEVVLVDGLLGAHEQDEGVKDYHLGELQELEDLVRRVRGVELKLDGMLFEVAGSGVSDEGKGRGIGHGLF